MARHSNRDRILEAAVTIAESSGLRGVTIEAVANEVGMTKGGVQYHFASKEDLMVAVEIDIWERSERAALAVLGKPPEEATAAERVEALLRSTQPGEVRAGELAFILDSARNGGPTPTAEAFYRRWVGDDGAPPDMARELATLAMDGLWLRDAIAGTDQDLARRDEVIDAIVQLYGGIRPRS